MRTFLAAAAFAAIIPAAANAATWVAICTDGQNLQYNQTVGGNGFLYLKTTGGTIPGNGTQIAPLNQTFFNGIAICGAVPGNGTGAGGLPLSQVCANKSTGMIYIKWQSPTPGTTMKDAPFCKATVTVH